jgi:hypothetical protein
METLEQWGLGLYEGLMITDDASRVGARRGLWRGRGDN